MAGRRSFRVTHEDGRTTPVYADSEAGALKQANHQEVTRATIAARRGLPCRPEMSMAVKAERGWDNYLTD